MKGQSFWSNAIFHNWLKGSHSLYAAAELLVIIDFCVCMVLCAELFLNLSQLCIKCIAIFTSPTLKLIHLVSHLFIFILYEHMPVCLFVVLCSYYLCYILLLKNICKNEWTAIWTANVLLYCYSLRYLAICLSNKSKQPLLILTGFLYCCRRANIKVSSWHLFPQRVISGWRPDLPVIDWHQERQKSLQQSSL